MVHQTNMKNHGFTGGASFGLAYTIVWRIHPKPRRCDEQPFVIEQLYPCTSQEWLWSGFRDINPIAASSPSYRFLLEPLLQAGCANIFQPLGVGEFIILVGIACEVLHSFDVHLLWPALPDKMHLDERPLYSFLLHFIHPCTVNTISKSTSLHDPTQDAA